MEDQVTKNQDVKTNAFEKMLDYLGFSNVTSYDSIISKLPFIIFLVFLAGIHIYNNHQAVKYVRDITKLELQLKELRWEYMTTKSELMFNSKQSEVAKVVNPKGIVEIVEPPYIIDVKK